MDFNEQEELIQMLPMDSESGQRQQRAPNRVARLSKYFSNGLRLFLVRRCTHRYGWIFLAIPCFVVVYIFWPGDTPPSTHLPIEPYDPVWSRRAASVKDAFLHAYGGYEMYTTFPDDELKPLSNSGARNFNGWGVTVVDSLDTMLLMGLEPEFDRAVAKVATLTFAMNENDHASFFETVIRYLGGLLSAHSLSNRAVLLARAEELGRKLLPAFNSPSGLPYYAVNTETGTTRDSSDRIGLVFLAEMASCQVEYKYLAHTTGLENFFLEVDRIVALMHEGQLQNGLWNTMWDLTSGKQVNNHIGVAAWADSAYEYLLKQYLLSNKTETRLKDMYLKAVSGVIHNLLFISPTRHLLYLSDITNAELTGKFEHLACFFPGLLALGASTIDMPESERQLHMWAAEGLAHSCWIMYADQASGLGPELAKMELWPGNWKEGRWIEHVDEWQRAGKPGDKPPGVKDPAPPVKAGEKRDYQLSVATYLSRPETLESMFIMWRTTRDVKWRERGWEIWNSIENKTRTSSGYASVLNVDSTDPSKIDSMPSYFLSETIKYAYLLAIDKDPWPVDKFVLNTEAHPLPIFEWTNWEKQRYGIV